MESITIDIAPVACAVFALIFVFYFYSRYKLKYWERRGVQQLQNTHYFFGNFKDAILLRSAPGWFLQKLHYQSPEDVPYFGFYVFQNPCLQLKDLDLMKQMFVKDFATFPDRYFCGRREKDSIGMRNLFSVRTPDWKYLRKRISPTVNIDKIKKMLPLMLESGNKMMEHLKRMKAGEDGRKHVDGQDLNCKYATDIIANVCLGTQLDSFNNPNTEFAKCTQQFFHSTERLRAMMCVFFLPGLVDVIGPMIYFDMSYFENMFRKVVGMREKIDVTRGDYIDSILKLKSGNQDPHYSIEVINLERDEDLFGQAGQFFSGFESGSLAASFALLEISRHKDIQNRAREDIQQAIAQYGWTYEAFKEMKYLEQCVLEGLRLYPPVPFLDRRAREDYRIPDTNVVVERGTAVYISIGALHRNPKYFADPDVFDPDRFGSGIPRSEAFMPFGLGPRSCVGPKLGILHVKTVLALLLNEYEVTYTGEKEYALDPRATFTLAANGLKMELRKLETSQKYT